MAHVIETKTFTFGNASITLRNDGTGPSTVEVSDGERTFVADEGEREAIFSAMNSFSRKTGGATQRRTGAGVSGNRSGNASPAPHTTTRSRSVAGQLPPGKSFEQAVAELEAVINDPNTQHQVRTGAKRKLKNLREAHGKK